jgi:hypothetical protein
MNKATVFGGAILLMALVVGCSSSPEDAVMKEMISTMNQMAEQLEKGNKADAEKLGAKMKELEQKAESWPKAKQEEMKKKYQGEMEAAAGRMLKAAFKGMKMPELKMPD